MPHEESPMGAAELIVFGEVRARRFCDKNSVRLSERDLEQAKRAIIAARKGQGCTAPFPCPCGESNL